MVFNIIHHIRQLFHKLHSQYHKLQIQGEDLYFLYIHLQHHQANFQELYRCLELLLQHQERQYQEQASKHQVLQGCLHHHHPILQNMQLGCNVHRK